MSLGKFFSANDNGHCAQSEVQLLPAKYTENNSELAVLSTLLFNDSESPQQNKPKPKPNQNQNQNHNQNQNQNQNQTKKFCTWLTAVFDNWDRTEGVHW